MSNLYQPFVEATRSVFSLMLDLQATECPVDGFVPRGETDIAVGIVGDMTGEVVYRFPEDTSLNMVKIMCGMEIESVDEFVTSAISEIANIISGNVMTLLAENDYRCDILPPAIGEETPGDYAVSSDLRISTTAGDVCLTIRLNPNK